MLPFLPADLAVRVPFSLLLVMTLLCTWYAIYFLARDKAAQPVAFAFGGEADPVDYARALADGGLLALLASLGLAQLSHETTPALVQLAASSLVFVALAAMPYRTTGAFIMLLIGSTALVLSGAPAVAALLLLIGIIVSLTQADTKTQILWQGLLFALLLVLALGWALGWLQWRIDTQVLQFGGMRRWAQLLVWFIWPAWLLALWTLWRWHKQLHQRHLLLPALLGGVVIMNSWAGGISDRALLLALPMTAALASFALPTFKRSLASLVDWFTLLFFSGAASAIWVIWLAQQTGWPAKPAANVCKLVPGFEAEFSTAIFLIAACASILWATLVFWRTRRHRVEMWRSLVLPASGATLCWLLLMTLWLPMLDYARSYAPFATRIAAYLPAAQPISCVQALGLTRAQTAALQHYGQFSVEPAHPNSRCEYLLIEPKSMVNPAGTQWKAWTFIANVKRPPDKNEMLFLFRKKALP